MNVDTENHPVATVPAVEIYDALCVTLKGSVKLAQLIAEAMAEETPSVSRTFCERVVFPLMAVEKFMQLTAEAEAREEARE